MLLISLVMLLVQVMASLVLQTWWNHNLIIDPKLRVVVDDFALIYQDIPQFDENFIESCFSNNLCLWNFLSRGP